MTSSPAHLLRFAKWAIVLGLLFLLPVPGEERKESDDDSPASEPSESATRETAPPPLTSQGVVDTLVTLGNRSLEDAWPKFRRLQDRFRRAPMKLAATVHNATGQLTGRAKLLAADLLTSRQEFYRDGQITLVDIATADPDADNRLSAMRLLGNKRHSDQVCVALTGVAESSNAPESVIEACRALWRIRRRNNDLKPLVRMLAQEDQRQFPAAIALAEMGQYPRPVRNLLRLLRDEPSARGRQAEQLIEFYNRRHPGRSLVPSDVTRELDRLRREHDELAKRLRQNQPETGWSAALSDVADLFRDHLINGQDLTDSELFVSAIKGFLRLDRYARFLGPHDLSQELQSLEFYRGYGLRLTKPNVDAPLVVVKAAKTGPAYRTGLRTGDRILSFNSISTQDRPYRDLTLLLKDDVPLILAVERSSPGDSEKQKLTFIVRRDKVETPIVRAHMLRDGGQKIAYLQIVHFGPNSAEQFRTKLSQLASEGARSAILDLRDNPGGEVEQAVRVVDALVTNQSDRFILKIEKRDGSRETRMPKPQQIFSRPIVILVNRHSASAAEIVAAALQDFSRAKVIGERTYGKGFQQESVQLPPRAQRLVGGKTFIMVTSGHLIRSNGASLENGVEPDAREASFWETFTVEDLAEVERVRFSSAVDLFIKKHLNDILAAHEQGTRWDPRDAGERFETLYNELETSLDRAETRRAIQSVIRLYVEDHHGRDFVGELSGDRVLKRAIAELALPARETEEP